MKTIAILGASGYIGRNLLASLAEMTGYRIKILSRRVNCFDDVNSTFPNVELCVGDLCDPKSLIGFLEPQCIVVNLAYSWSGGAVTNLDVAHNLVSICRTAQVARLIHCSTAAVVGRVAVDQVTENTLSRPITEYGITKLQIEKILIAGLEGVCDVVVLRPTAVFGIDAAPLKKLVNDLTVGNRFQNYLKSCLFGRRRMNLVHIDNVIEAISFFVNYAEKLNGEIFIVSDDDSDANNFSYVENLLIEKLHIRRYIFPPISIPLGFLTFLLRCLGRNNVNPRCNYSPGKLINLGFRRPKSFESGLTEYVESLCSLNNSSQ